MIDIELAHVDCRLNIHYVDLIDNQICRISPGQYSKLDVFVTDPNNSSVITVLTLATPSPEVWLARWPSVYRLQIRSWWVILRTCDVVTAITCSLHRLLGWHTGSSSGVQWTSSPETIYIASSQPRVGASLSARRSKEWRDSTSLN